MINPMEEACKEAYPTKVRVSIIGKYGGTLAFWMAEHENGARESEGLADAVVRLPTGEYQLVVKRFVEVADESMA